MRQNMALRHKKRRNPMQRSSRSPRRNVKLARPQRAR